MAEKKPAVVFKLDSDYNYGLCVHLVHCKYIEGIVIHGILIRIFSCQLLLLISLWNSFRPPTCNLC